MDHGRHCRGFWILDAWKLDLGRLVTRVTPPLHADMPAHEAQYMQGIWGIQRPEGAWAWAIAANGRGAHPSLHPVVSLYTLSTHSLAFDTLSALYAHMGT